jgi:hypothetical protein
MAASSSVACMATLARSECVVVYHRRSTRDTRASLRGTRNSLNEAGGMGAVVRLNQTSGTAGLG